MRFKRVLLKVSGEALKAPDGILDAGKLAELAGVIVKCAAEGAEIAVVTGAGNICRGAGLKTIKRTAADNMGMLATAINSIALAEAINAVDPNRAVVLSAFPVGGICEEFSAGKAVRHLEKKRAVIIAGGTGRPFFSTDTGAMLRACEIQAGAALMAKNVDGVYDKNPGVYKDAKKFAEISYEEAVSRKLTAVDLAASILGMENNIPSYVFALNPVENIYKIIHGENTGTYVYKGGE